MEFGQNVSYNINYSYDPPYEVTGGVINHFRETFVMNQLQDLMLKLTLKNFLMMLNPCKKLPIHQVAQMT